MGSEGNFVHQFWHEPSIPSLINPIASKPIWVFNLSPCATIHLIRDAMNRVSTEPAISFKTHTKPIA